MTSVVYYPKKDKYLDVKVALLVSKHREKVILVMR